MYFSDRITLRAISATTQDSDGYPKLAMTDTEVWADKKSITRSEYYAANANGLNVSIAFSVHVEDYEGQTEIAYNGKSYKVVRYYQKGEGIIELICSVKTV